MQSVARRSDYSPHAIQIRRGYFFNVHDSQLISSERNVQTIIELSKFNKSPRQNA